MKQSYPGVRARQSSIQLEFSYKGIRCRETIRLLPTPKNLELAFSKKQTILYEIETNQFDYAKHFPRSKNAIKLSNNPGHHTKVRKLLNDWLLVSQKRCQKSTLREYKLAISNHLDPEFGGLFVAELQYSHVQQWISSLELSGKTINNILIPLRRCMEVAYIDGLIEKNPMDRIKNLKFTTREPDPFSKEEIRKILSHLKGASRNLVQFAFSTGLRTSELIALKWTDIEEDKKQMHVRSAIVRGQEKSTKTKAGLRTVLLDQRAMKALNEQRQFTFESKDRVFKDPFDNVTNLDDQRIRRKIWKPALSSAAIRYRSPYQTRHTFASNKLMEGKNPFWVATQMGHSSPNQTFQSYARWIQQDAS